MKYVTLPKRQMVSAKSKRLLAAKSGYQCSFPDCSQNLMVGGESFIGEIAFIESISANGPRHNPASRNEDLISLDNIILLCPNHHKTIDRKPDIYTTEWLKKAKSDHLNRVTCSA